jgi:hypothetical protein
MKNNEEFNVSDVIRFVDRGQFNENTARTMSIDGLQV